MYFSINTGNGYHIWRQRFPNGVPEQVTSGATEEQEIAFDPDGHSFLTSIGTRQSTLWVHDAHGERQITSEGYASLPRFSPDGKKLYFLQRSRTNRHYVSGELWATNLETRQRQRLLPDFLLGDYSISQDGSGPSAGVFVQSTGRVLTSCTRTDEPFEFAFLSSSCDCEFAPEDMSRLSLAAIAAMRSGSLGAAPSWGVSPNVIEENAATSENVAA